MKLIDRAQHVDGPTAPTGGGFTPPVHPLPPSPARPGEEWVTDVDGLAGKPLAIERDVWNDGSWGGGNQYDSTFALHAWTSDSKPFLKVGTSFDEAMRTAIKLLPRLRDHDPRSPSEHPAAGVLQGTDGAFYVAPLGDPAGNIPRGFPGQHYQGVGRDEKYMEIRWMPVFPWQKYRWDRVAPQLLAAVGESSDHKGRAQVNWVDMRERAHDLKAKAAPASWLG